jgi:hypothetical protein
LTGHIEPQNKQPTQKENQTHENETPVQNPTRRRFAVRGD